MDIQQLKKNYKARIIDGQMQKYLRAFGAVCIDGPKWCGKTWTSFYHSKSAIFLDSPDNNFQNRRLAEISPALVLEGDTPRLIDEWQEVPALWDAVRHTVDDRAAKGQFILTGSSTPKNNTDSKDAGKHHSGAGRIGKLRMSTMSLYETGESSGVVSLHDLCEGKFIPTMTGNVSLKDLTKYVVRGGWPGNIGADGDIMGLLPSSYIETILSDDTQRIDDTKYDTHKMRMLLMSLARNESTTATKSKLISDITEHTATRIDDDTVATYLDVFERLYIIDNQPAYSANLRSSVRLKQAPKRHFCDPSLACALLKATPERLIGDLNTFGFMFESLCEHDLKIYAQSFGGQLFHYQDYKNREIDAVIELPDGKWCAFEIKLGENQVDKAAEGLIALRDSIVAEGGVAPSVLSVICGLTSAAYQRPDGVYVVPITALKD